MFVDHVKIYVSAGNGGHGCVSFRRERYVRRGGPDGGHGGHGGSVVLAATPHLQCLEPLRYQGHYRAENGQPGSGKRCHGRNGEDLVVDVPPGTVVRAADSGELLADLDREGARFVAARGGRGGRGNSAFVSATHQAPREAEKGTEGQERTLELELKIVADVGLVGYPNAGKSTLLGTLTNASPEVAAYPFTTLTPHVGTVTFDDFFSFRVADIPGLVEGAHRNVGLGHDFLRHVERTHVLVYVLDMAGVDGRDPGADLATLQRELECHQAGLASRPALVVANKMDEPGTDDALAAVRAATDLEVFPFCAVLGERKDELLARLRRLVEREGAGKHPE